MTRLANRPYDAATKFRAPGSEAITASAIVGEIALDKMVNLRASSQRGKLGAAAYDVVIAVESITSSGDQSYMISLQTGPRGAAATTVASVPVVETGQYVIELDPQTLQILNDDAEVLQMTVTLGGTSPSIKFAAWLL